MERNTHWNIIDEKQFKTITGSVFKSISTVLSNTIGPYGATTFIENHDDFHVTKDGWNILKRIHLDNPTEEKIVSLLRNIALNVVRNVGDGSTTSIVASDSILDGVRDLNLNIRQKELIDIMRNSIDEITKEVRAHSNPVKGPDDIYRIALVSTNGDEKLSSIIRDIYEKTDNPSIDFQESYELETTHEIINGYKAHVSMVDSIYVTEDEEKVGVYTNPSVILFNHRVEYEAHNPFLHEIIDEAIQTGKTLFIIAPHFDQRFLDSMGQLTRRLVNAGHTSLPVVLARFRLIRNSDHHLLGDLAALLGAEVVTDTVTYEINKTEPIIDEEGVSRFVRVETDYDAKNFVGGLEKIRLGETESVFSGFNNVNETMLKAQQRDASVQLEKERRNSVRYEAGDLALYYATVRNAKLSCSMGTIRAGGSSAIDRTVTYDAIEDAVRACESAYYNGYNLGGSFAIPLAVDRILERREHEMSEEEVAVYKMLRDSFLRVFDHVMFNYDRDKLNNTGDLTPEEISSRRMEIYQKVKETGNCYNILTNEYDEDVINPTDTDVEVLKAAVSIVSLLQSSNQYVTIRPEYKMD